MINPRTTEYKGSRDCICSPNRCFILLLLSFPLNETAVCQVHDGSQKEELSRLCAFYISWPFGGGVIVVAHRGLCKFAIPLFLEHESKARGASEGLHLAPGDTTQKADRRGTIRPPKQTRKREIPQVRRCTLVLILMLPLRSITIPKRRATLMAD